MNDPSDDPICPFCGLPLVELGSRRLACADCEDQFTPEELFGSMEGGNADQ
jgi:uncharacterized Zn finger protein (UPF0148 family)